LSTSLDISTSGLNSAILDFLLPVKSCNIYSRFIGLVDLENIDFAFQIVLDSMYTAIDDKKIIVLDLPAAFDTINNSILLRRLQCDFGIAGVVFDCMDWVIPIKPEAVYLDIANIALVVHHVFPV